MAKMKAPETMGGNSTYLANEEQNEGWYLFCVIDAQEGRYSYKEDFKPMDGFSFDCEVVGGMHDGKKFQFKLFDGKEGSKDHGVFASQKQFAMLVATDVCKPSQLGTDLEYDPTEATGALFIAKLLLKEPDKDGKRYLDLSYTDAHHVDDPRVANIKLDDHQRAKVAAMKPVYRHTKEYFEPLMVKKQKGEPAAKAEKPNFDDL